MKNRILDFKLIIRILLLITIMQLMTGCSSKVDTVDKNIDLFKKDFKNIKTSILFNVNNDEIILKKSEYVKKKDNIKKIDLGDN